MRYHPNDVPREAATALVGKIMAMISEAFSDPERLGRLDDDLVDLVADELKQRDAKFVSMISGPPAMNPPRPEPPPPPPSRELLMKYIAHVSELHGAKLLVSFQKSSVQFSRREMTELYELEAAYTTGQKL